MQKGPRGREMSDVKDEATGEVLAKDIAFIASDCEIGQVPDVKLSWPPDGPPVAILNSAGRRVTIQLPNGRKLAGFVKSVTGNLDLRHGRSSLAVLIQWDRCT